MGQSCLAVKRPDAPGRAVRPAVWVVVGISVISLWSPTHADLVQTDFSYTEDIWPYRNQRPGHCWAIANLELEWYRMRRESPGLPRLSKAAELPQYESQIARLKDAAKRQQAWRSRLETVGEHYLPVLGGAKLVRDGIALAIRAGDPCLVMIFKDTLKLPRSWSELLTIWEPWYHTVVAVDCMVVKVDDGDSPAHSYTLFGIADSNLPEQKVSLFYDHATRKWTYHNWSGNVEVGYLPLSLVPMLGGSKRARPRPVAGGMADWPELTVFLMDRSTSMNAEDKRVVEKLADAVANNRLPLHEAIVMDFSGSGNMAATQVLSDTGILASALRKSDIARDSGTAILDALNATISHARNERPTAQILIVLLTDGEEWRDGQIKDPRVVTSRLEADGNMGCLVCLTSSGRKANAPTKGLLESPAVERLDLERPSGGGGAW